jgi:hypothetical protein
MPLMWSSTIGVIMSSMTRLRKYDKVWYWLTKLPERKNTACKIIARGKMNSILVEFASDGYRVITSRWAVRGLKPIILPLHYGRMTNGR